MKKIMAAILCVVMSFGMIEVRAEVRSVTDVLKNTLDSHFVFFKAAEEYLDIDKELIDYDNITIYKMYEYGISTDVSVPHLFVMFPLLNSEDVHMVFFNYENIEPAGKIVNFEVPLKMPIPNEDDFSEFLSENDLEMPEEVYLALINRGGWSICSYYVLYDGVQYVIPLYLLDKHQGNPTDSYNTNIEFGKVYDINELIDTIDTEVELYKAFINGDKSSEIFEDDEYVYELDSKTGEITSINTKYEDLDGKETINATEKNKANEEENLQGEKTEEDNEKVNTNENEKEENIQKPVSVKNEKLYSDVDDLQLEQILSNLSEIDIIKGYEDKTFKPQNKITRAEVCAMLSRMLEKSFEPGDINFSDVSKNHWAFGNIFTMKELGVINGYEDNTFRPENNITYQEYIKMAVTVLEFGQEAEELGGYPEGFLKVAEEKGLTQSLEFNPSDEITRADAAIIISNIINI